MHHATIFSKLFQRQSTGWVISIHIDIDIYEKDIRIECNKLFWNTSLYGKPNLQQRLVRGQLRAQHGTRTTVVLEIDFKDCTTVVIDDEFNKKVVEHARKIFVIIDLMESVLHILSFRCSLIVPSKGVTTTRCISNKDAVTSKMQRQDETTPQSSSVNKEKRYHKLINKEHFSTSSSSSSSSASVVSTEEFIYNKLIIKSSLQQAHHQQEQFSAGSSSARAVFSSTPSTTRGQQSAQQKFIKSKQFDKNSSRTNSKRSSSALLPTRSSTSSIRTPSILTS